MDVADRFVTMGIQEWGQSEEVRVKAVQGVLDAAGFNAKATCWPVFGGIWPKKCNGPDSEEASKWLKAMTDTMTRGRVQDEISHVEKCIQDRLQTAK